MSSALRSDLFSKRFLLSAATWFFAWAGIIAILGQILDWTFKLAKYEWWGQAVLGVALVGIPLSMWRSWPRPIEETYESPSTRIRIVKGDLFDEGGHLVIGTCDTFDTAIPNIIARTSLQGIALERLYGNDVAKLDADLDAALSSTAPRDTVTKVGKTVRYPLGTVAVVERPPRKLFFVAYTMMDEHNNAQGTPDGLWVSLNALWSSISKHGNGHTVCMPVIGGGMSRMSNIVPTQDSIRFTILSFMFASRNNKVCDELRLVLRPQDYERLDRLELQAFLTSLKPS
ncbi:macro domain-containing protein [Rhodococcus erythropolis]